MVSLTISLQTIDLKAEVWRPSGESPDGCDCEKGGSRGYTRAAVIRKNGGV